MASIIQPRICIVKGPGLPVPSGLWFRVQMGMTALVVLLIMASVRPASLSVHVRSSTLMPCSLATRIAMLRVMPPKTWLSNGWVTKVPSMMAKILVEQPSRTWPCSFNQKASSASWAWACCLPNTLASKAMDLISQCFQRISYKVMAWIPVATFSSDGFGK